MAMGRAVHRFEAGRYVRMAQVGAAVLVVGAGLMWAVPIPGLNAPFRETKAVEEAPVATPPVTPVVKQDTFDRDTASNVAEAMETLAGHKKEDKIVVKDPPPPPASTDWKYLGPIFDGDSIRALVTVTSGGASRQKVLRQGAEVEKTTLTAITPEELTLKDESGTERKVRRLGDSGASVAWLRGVPGNRAGPANGAGANGANGTNGAGGPNGTAGAAGTGQRLPIAPPGGGGRAAAERRARAAEASRSGAAPDGSALGEAAVNAAAKLKDAAGADAATGLTTLKDMSNDSSLPDDLQDIQNKILTQYTQGSLTLEQVIKELTGAYGSHGMKFDPGTIDILAQKLKEGR